MAEGDLVDLRGGGYVNLHAQALAAVGEIVHVAKSDEGEETRSNGNFS